MEAESALLRKILRHSEGYLFHYDGVGPIRRLELDGPVTLTTEEADLVEAIWSEPGDHS